MFLFHDDDCGEFLTAQGLCPKCGFYPDGQSTAFRAPTIEEMDSLHRFDGLLGPGRARWYPESLRGRQ